MTMTSSAEVSRLTSEAYRELRGLAARFLSRERNHHTLTPTALVHEAYCRLQRSSGSSWVTNREHFMATAATTLRRVLVDYARARGTLKRPVSRAKMSLDNLPEPRSQDSSADNMLAFEEALSELAETNPRRARIVELRLFGGLSGKEIASLMGLSESVISEEWSAARLTIAKRLLDSRS